MTNNLSKPQIRFKGFTEAWEQRKLGDISESYSGGTPTVGEKEYYDGNIPFIRSGEINSDKTELFLSENGLNNSSAKMVKIGDILYALYGATSGEVSISKLNGAINQAILVIQPHQNHNNYFLMQWLRKSKKMIIGTYLQGGQGNLSGNIVKELSIDLPFCDEQKLIGTFFNKLDSLITLHQRKLIFLKLHRFLMSVLFCYSWEQRKLNDLYKFQYGEYNNNPDNGGQYPIYGANGKIGGFTKFNAENSIIIGHMGEYAGSVIYEKNKHFVTYNGTITLKKDGSNPNYYDYSLLSNANINKICTSSGLPFLSYDKLKSISIYTSINYIEQEKMGRLFDRLDSLITLHQRKQL